MQRTKIEGSSNIAEIGYDPDSLTLEIKFHNGKLYQYHPIATTGWKAFLKAKSKGNFFWRFIRHNKQITCTNVTELQANS